jgi:hypothetical protein
MDGCTDENRDDRGSNSFMYFVCSFFRSFFLALIILVSSQILKVTQS